MLRRFSVSLFDFARVNRRMHNKLFIADGAMAVAGGRNIGNQYFTKTAGANFIDLDTFVAGALIPRLGSLFDLYWNSDYVRPIETVVAPARPRDERQRRFEELTSAASTPPPRPTAPNDVLGYSPIVEDIKAGKLDLIWTTAEAYADSPERVIGKQVTYGGVPLLDVDSVRYNVVEQMRRGRSDVTLVSPYLIPGKAGLEVMREIRARGMKISVVTNSLAATDEPVVHTGYRRYRADMLRLGRRDPRVEFGAHAAQRAPGPLRHADRAPACEVGRDRRAHAVRRLDELRPALGGAQHRDRTHHLQPRDGAAGAETDRGAEAAGRLQGALRTRHRDDALGERRGRRRAGAHRRARCGLLGPPDAGTAGAAGAGELL